MSFRFNCEWFRLTRGVEGVRFPIQKMIKINNGDEDSAEKND